VGDATTGASWPRLDRTIDGAALGFLMTVSISLAVSESLAIIACLAWFVRSWLARGHERLRWPLVWPVGTFLALSLISALASRDPGAALLELRSAWLAWALFLLFVNRLRSIDQMMIAVRVLIACGSVAGIYALVQAGIHGAEFRVTGPLGHYMTFSGLMMIVFLLAAAQLLFQWRGSGRGWLVASCLVSLLAMLATQTRAAVIGLAAGAVVLAWFREKRLLLVLPVAGLVLFLAAPEPISARWRSLVDLTDVTAIERLYMWRGGLDLIQDNPWTGVGPSLVAEAFPEYRLPGDPWLAHRRWTHLHNSPLQVAAERGVPALLAWFWIWAVFAREAGRRLATGGTAGTAHRACAVGSAAAVTAFLVMGLFEDNFSDTEVITAVAFVLALAFARLEPAGSDTTAC